MAQMEENKGQALAQTVLNRTGTIYNSCVELITMILVSLLTISSFTTLLVVRCHLGYMSDHRHRDRWYDHSDKETPDNLHFNIYSRPANEHTARILYCFEQGVCPAMSQNGMHNNGTRTHSAQSTFQRQVLAIRSSACLSSFLYSCCSNYHSLVAIFLVSLLWP